MNYIYITLRCILAIVHTSAFSVLQCILTVHLDCHSNNCVIRRLFLIMVHHQNELERQRVVYIHIFNSRNANVSIQILKSLYVLNIAVSYSYGYRSFLYFTKVLSKFYFYFKHLPCYNLGLFARLCRKSCFCDLALFK